MYGFKKVKRAVDSESFFHPYFTRDNKSSLCMIQRRKKCKENKSCSEDNSEEQQPTNKCAVESVVSPRSVKREDAIPFLEPTEEPQMLPMLPERQPIYYEVRPYPYLYDDSFSQRFIQPMPYDPMRQPYYGMLYR